MSLIAPGTVLVDTYEIVEHISTGGMGEVYRGLNIHNDEVVAIKVVLASRAADQTILSLFQKESTVLRRLAHPAIVRYEVFTRDRAIGRPFLVMEFVDGPSLADELDRRKLHEDEVLVLLRRLASGLEAAHAAGVVHRDISPDNVILCAGIVAEAKIIDFGIAKSSAPGTGTLVGNLFAGKPGYVAPEQLGHFGGDVGPQADIYSLGLLIAAAAIGSPIDMGDNVVAAVQARTKVPDLTGVPERLLPLITWMLEPDPSDRAKSMAEVLQAVDTIESGTEFEVPGTAEARGNADAESEPFVSTKAATDDPPQPTDDLDVAAVPVIPTDLSDTARRPRKPLPPTALRPFPTNISRPPESEAPGISQGPDDTDQPSSKSPFGIAGSASDVSYSPFSSWPHGPGDAGQQGLPASEPKQTSIHADLVSRPLPAIGTGSNPGQRDTPQPSDTPTGDTETAEVLPVPFVDESARGSPFGPPSAEMIDPKFAQVTPGLKHEPPLRRRSLALPLMAALIGLGGVAWFAFDTISGRRSQEADGNQTAVSARAQSEWLARIRQSPEDCIAVVEDHSSQSHPATILIFAKEDNAADRIETRYRNDLGANPHLERRAIAPTQCAAINFFNGIASTSGFSQLDLRYAQGEISTSERVADSLALLGITPEGRLISYSGAFSQGNGRFRIPQNLSPPEHETLLFVAWTIAPNSLISGLMDGVPVAPPLEQTYLAGFADEMATPTSRPRAAIIGVTLPRS